VPSRLNSDEVPTSTSCQASVTAKLGVAKLATAPKANTPTVAPVNILCIFMLEIPFFVLFYLLYHFNITQQKAYVKPHSPVFHN
jgi:hypothetical protein